MAPHNVANGVLECPPPESCIVDETEPKDCECTYAKMNMQQFLTLNQRSGSHADFFDAVSAPNDPVFWLFHNFYGMLFEKWASNAEEKPSKENDFSGFPTENTHSCYGEAFNISSPVNKNFCFTAKDLNITECNSEHTPLENNAHLNDDNCCTNEDLLNFILEDGPLQKEI